MDMFTKFLALLTLLVCSACAYQPVWVKQGSGQSELEQAKADCLLEAHRKVPENLGYQLQPGRNYSSSNCDKHGCTNYETYQPPQVTTFDKNADVRDQIMRGCMYRAGWADANVQ